MRQKVGLVYAYFDNPTMLKAHLGEWMNYDLEAKNRFQFIVVDDGSPSAPALTTVREAWGLARPLDLQIYRVEVNKPWGQDAARNIGMKHVEALWSLVTDMDHMLSRAGARRMLQFVDDTAHRGSYYMPGRCRTSGAPYHSHPNTFLFHKGDYWDMGGYDEDFVGWYGSDGNFRKCAKGHGLDEVPVDTFKMVLYGTNDVTDCNTRGFSRKDGEYWAVHNPELNRKRMGPAYRAVNPFRSPYHRVL